ncbi:site-specific integrase [Kitasatospora sp. GP82]|uniref:site-specific integrase n=1 Tax=Kitasatospora sp. GP82 TaxID=3035089 RepID=UPI00247614D7|nr:site-specific integrase [Kitasatospora sp. GP82]MDH6123944.1 integrase [Kitasatospora sp. GP82]
MGTPRPRRFEFPIANKARQFLAATSGCRLHALFELALHTGFRKGELLGLRWENLDLTGGTASIRRTLQRTNTGGLVALPTKTQSSERRIALPTPCLRSLARHRDQQRRERETAGESWQDRGYVFTRPNGAPIEGATLTRHFTALLRATLRRIRFHDLRHSAATLLLEQGIELVVIKELLGHAHIGVTATVYAHVRLRLQRQAIDTLGDALRAPKSPNGPPSAEPVRWRCRQRCRQDAERPHRTNFRWGLSALIRKSLPAIPSRPDGPAAGRAPAPGNHQDLRIQPG